MRFLSIFLLLFLPLQSLAAQEYDWGAKPDFVEIEEKNSPDNFFDTPLNPINEDKKSLRYSSGLLLNASYSGLVSSLWDEKLFESPKEKSLDFRVAKSSYFEYTSPKTNIIGELDSLPYRYNFETRKGTFLLDRDQYRLSFKKDAKLPLGEIRHAWSKGERKVVGNIEHPSTYEDSWFGEDHFLVSYKLKIKFLQLMMGYNKSSRSYSNPYPMLSFSKISEKLEEKKYFLDFSATLGSFIFAFNWNSVRGFYNRHERIDIKNNIFLASIFYQNEWLKFEMFAGNRSFSARILLELWQLQILSSLEQRSPTEEEKYGRHEYLEGNPFLLPSTRAQLGLSYSEVFRFKFQQLQTKLSLTHISDIDRIRPYPKTLYYYSYNNTGDAQYLQLRAEVSGFGRYNFFSWESHFSYLYNHILQSEKKIFNFRNHDFRMVFDLSFREHISISAFYRYLSPSNPSFGMKTKEIHASALMLSIHDQKSRLYLLLRGLSQKSYFSETMRPIKGFEVFLGLAYNKAISEFEELEDLDF